MVASASGHVRGPGTTAPAVVQQLHRQGHRADRQHRPSRPKRLPPTPSRAAISSRRLRQGSPFRSVSASRTPPVRPPRSRGDGLAAKRARSTRHLAIRGGHGDRPFGNVVPNARRDVHGPGSRRSGTFRSSTNTIASRPTAAARPPNVNANTIAGGYSVTRFGRRQSTPPASA